VTLIISNWTLGTTVARLALFFSEIYHHWCSTCMWIHGLFLQVWNMQTAAEMNLTGSSGKVYALVVATELIFAATQVSFHLFLLYYYVLMFLILYYYVLMFLILTKYIHSPLLFSIGQTYMLWSFFFVWL